MANSHRQLDYAGKDRVIVIGAVANFVWSARKVSFGRRLTRKWPGRSLAALFCGYFSRKRNRSSRVNSRGCLTFRMLSSLWAIVSSGWRSNILGPEYIMIALPCTFLAGL